MNFCVACAAVLCASAVVAAADPLIQTGVGIADVTGPATEIDFMGYAFPTQTGAGIHMRLFSRAFIFQDANNNRAVYVSLDLCMAMMSFKQGVVARLEQLGFGAVYNETNVALSGIHTHSGPGAFSWFLLYDISMLGINKKHVAAVVEGITQSILNAHANLLTNRPAPIYLVQGLLANASRNRSPSSYLANPVAEQAAYAQWGGDTDHNMTVISLADGNGAELGAISFFAVHCTSMHNTNHLVSSDNKGYASYRFEQLKNGNASIPGKGSFVAAFGQSNLGDVSPNTLGAWCNGTVGGQYCGDDRSVCNGRNEDCVSVGPAGFLDDTGSTAIIGNLQFQRAVELFDAAEETGILVNGAVKFVHTWVNMSSLDVDAKFTTTGQNATTCRPAVGFSFAAGTTDGPGAFNFYQGDNCSTCLPFWNYVKNFIKKPTPEQIACQGVKPILLDVGEIEPHPWVPLSLPLQLIQIGPLVLIVAPTELTTMAGRRLRNAVQAVFTAHNQDVTVVIAGLANTYSGYTTTYEEYQWQRYEAASTLYGPNQLAAYTQEYVALATALVTGASVPPGVPHNNQSVVDFYLHPGVIIDSHPAGMPFGAVVTAPLASYTVGSTVNVTFQSGNLRNDFLQNSSYMLVERHVAGQPAVLVMTDANWETKVHWAKTGEFQSQTTCQWDIPAWMAAGAYTITHQGFYKPSATSESVLPYAGTSTVFQVTVAP